MVIDAMKTSSLRCGVDGDHRSIPGFPPDGYIGCHGHSERRQW